MSAVNGANVTDSNGVHVESGMIRSMVRMLAAIGLAAFTVLFIILPSGLFDNFGSPESAFAARLRMGGSWQSVIFGGAVLVGVTLIATWALYHGLRKLEPNLDANAIAEAHFLDTLEFWKG